MRQVLVMSALAAAGLTATVASADEVVTFAYNNLAGSYTAINASSGSFTANATDMPGLQSIGDVTRTVPVAGTADFAAGFVSRADLANFTITVSVDMIDQILGIATGTGSFTITDLDGTTLSGDIDGLWIRGGLGQTFFNGNLTNVVFSGASFDGDNGSFSTSFGPGDLEGAVTQLFLRPGDGGFFTQSFADVATQVQGQIVPTPGALALMGVGGLVASRRRR